MAQQYYQQNESKQTLREAPYVTAPPPMGYPVMMSDSPQTVQQPPHQPQNRGSGGFLRGCLAAMCCCCVLDCVF